MGYKMYVIYCNELNLYEDYNCIDIIYGIFKKFFLLSWKW